MYCSSCGAAVVGRYCSCCGKRVRSEVEEFRATERKAKKAYTDQMEAMFGKRHFEALHIAEACWIACDFKYGREKLLGSIYTKIEVAPDAYKKLETIREHATKLCERILTADDY